MGRNFVECDIPLPPWVLLDLDCDRLLFLPIQGPTECEAYEEIAALDALYEAQQEIERLHKALIRLCALPRPWMSETAMKLKPKNWPTEPGHYWAKKYPRAVSETVMVEEFEGLFDIWTVFDRQTTLEVFKRDHPDALFSDRIPEPEVEP